MDTVNIILTKEEAAVVTTFIKSTLEDIKDSGLKPDPIGSQIVVCAQSVLTKINKEVENNARKK